ncbi:DUF1330 domain-containing protein [Pseudoalteromonas sp. R3]|uniref:DUF1330 domain-containing protein n=1 Tax=Pseudoalteromonas sp. R3 TaxID=1709477 RepID=UPI0006B5CFA3|nr:DUF1330 domain-containing protein [Pseudoalteromonas sp. R3]AZZ98622.1 DUF1330 domain-containing protein [Pseudoalteromonas sp. R3]
MYEYLVGLEVSDDEVYSQYRAAMMPILVRYRGGFGFDFIVSEVLKSETDKPINRVFTIYFPSKEVADEFFSDPDYLEVKARYFEASVAHTSIISGYEKHN